MPSSRDRALSVLLDPALSPIVDMVLWSPGPDRYEVASADGRVRFTRGADGFTVDGVEGDDPLADQSPGLLAGLPAELGDPHPSRSGNSYPYAFEQVAQLFDHSAAPDLCVVHSAAHNWEDAGGHRGEHGSLGVVQARAPFVIAGAGVRADGLVPRAGRLVDVAPTVCALLGVERYDDGTYLRGQDGDVRTDVLDGSSRPKHVVGFLLDGANPNVLYALAEAGIAPNIGRLMAMGTSYAHGAMAGLPTVTLANHTSILTGRYPGHHGILHNAWYDRSTGEQVITNSQATWPWSMQHCVEGVESIHDAVHRTWPEAFTASVNEPCDIGADYSTFDFFRKGEVPPIPDTPDGLPHVTERFVRPHKDYSWSTVVDHMGTEQSVGIWSGHYRDVTYPKPTFMWCNYTLTDSAFHIGGPHSEIADASVRDTDARIGEVLAAVERAGAFDDTAFVLVADHGMQQTDPEVTGDWDVALRDAGIRFRDEGYGFLYLDED
ncbi:MAG TPA: alkaline phosphatase family protein [Acidimicrobiia bacterium]|nr:alkaline phosphatase family protein [Acidimicrobiia bacterium]